MRVTRVEMEGITTSFRYPHFIWGRQPTYEMPPPATIYGHICSAVGEWVDPGSLRFGYWFNYLSKGEDLEYIHAISRREDFRREKDTKEVFAWEKRTSNEINVGGTINPLTREFLFRPRLILYIYPADYTAALRRPHYSAILGRSQDLVTYRHAEEVELVTTDRAYYEHTLLPWELRTRLGRGVAVTMPRFIDYQAGRQVIFDRYLVLRERVWDRPDAGGDEEAGAVMLRYADQPLVHLVDPESEESTGCRRGVWMHSFLPGGDDHATTVGRAASSA